MPLGPAAGQEFCTPEHQVIIGLDYHESRKDTLQTSPPDFTPPRLDCAESHLTDGHERHDDGSTVDDGPDSGSSVRITTSFKGADTAIVSASTDVEDLTD